MNLTYACARCEKPQTFDTQDCPMGEHLTECQHCGCDNVVHLEVCIDITNLGEYVPHKPACCPNCGHSLDAFVGLTSIAICSLCPKCREPYSIKIEREVQQ